MGTIFSRRRSRQAFQSARTWNSGFEVSVVGRVVIMLQVLDRLGEGAVAILSGIAGYVLGGVEKGDQAPSASTQGGNATLNSKDLFDGQAEGI